jgi:aminoglycoside phosphotransferase (APT) family kinase protein
VDKAGITPSLVAALIEEQFPQWAALTVTRVALDGWDNATFRLGDAMSVRLPSADSYVAQVEKEHRWLPILGRVLPLPIPEPLALGSPGCGYPRPWSIYRWLEGEYAAVDRVANLCDFATTLGDFLAVLYHVDPRHGPPPGPHNLFRGVALSVYDGETRNAIGALADAIDANAATAVWEAAFAAPWCGPDVWLHGDVAPSNLLVVDGRLSAVIDFGCCGVGDPACDLTIAWTFFDEASGEAFRSRLDLDEATWARGRGWALWKALIVLDGFSNSKRQPLDDGQRRAGWRVSAREVIDALIADHRRDT